MKKVSLLGDSIRLSYQDHVRERLADSAEVWAPEGNCMHSVHHVLNLGWYLTQPADVIHFNFGLWDCRRLARDRTENIVPVEIFARNLDHIITTVRANTEAILIWATITPIVEARYNARFSAPHDPCRDARDVAIYNTAAAEVTARHGIRVNDLHALVVSHGAEKMISNDGVHYDPPAAALLADRVAEEVMK